MTDTNNKLEQTVEEILDEIECNVYPVGDDTWGISTECDREYLGEYIKNKIKELVKGIKNNEQ